MTAKEAAESIKRYADALLGLKRAKIARTVIAPDLRQLAYAVGKSPETEWHSREKTAQQSVFDALDFLLWRVPFGQVFLYGRFNPHRPETDRYIAAFTLPPQGAEALVKSEAWREVRQDAEKYRGTDHESCTFEWQPEIDWDGPHL